VHGNASRVGRRLLAPGGKISACNLASSTKADQKKRGRFLGGTAPFGWQVGEDGELLELPEQQAMIRQIIELRQEGLSLRAIAFKIGHAVSHVKVKSILSEAQLRGIYDRPFAKSIHQTSV
jgi:hypothetical protein